MAAILGRAVGGLGSCQWALHLEPGWDPAWVEA